MSAAAPGAHVGTVVVIDGKLCPPAEQVVSVFDRGFLYGDSVFETLRTYGGKAFALDAHLERLSKSAALVFIPVPLEKASFGREIEAAIAAGANPESYVRVMITRGQGSIGLDPALADRPRRVIIVQPLSLPPAIYYANGVGAVSYRTQRNTDRTGAEGAKIGNYLVSVLAMREATRAGAVEALVVDAEGRVLEGSSSNVFVVSAGKLVTAPTTAGILAGITRHHVLELAAELGIDVELRAPTLEEAYRADEIFISSSIRELMPIVRLDQRSIGGGRPGAVFRRLLEAFRVQVEAGASLLP
jgi:branched-chain amino acid aminotransferase